MNQTKGFLALVSTAAILGTFGVLIRELAKTFSDPGQVFARSLFATLIIALVVLYKKINPLDIGKKNLKYVLAFSVVFPLSILCFTVSANLIKVTNSLFMLYVGSLVSTAIFGRVLFKEKFTLKHIAALVLVFIGLSFFVYPFSVESITLGLVLGLFSGIFEGSSHTLRKLMKDVKREVVVFYQSLSGVILASGLLLFSNEVFIKEFHLSAIFVALLFGLLLVSIGYLLVYGFGNFDVNWGTIILATELFFAIVINSVFLKEYPTSYELIGGLLIFSGTAITTLKLNKGNKKAMEKKKTAVSS
ncbi:DMT family transporter [Candidatus Woesebacteria bacterium]|nr:DMT family transporter [Candidatus Woesebacteria bacterium]